MTVKITCFEAENVKRIKAVQFAPSESGLTIIGGDNRQGKTSILDAIAWTLGGANFAPSNPQNSTTDAKPETAITLSNGLKVERCGKNSSLKVTDPSGEKAGQELLNEFISRFALDLPRFINANDKDKAFILLDTLGIKEKLTELERNEQALYDERTEIGRTALALKKHAEEMPFYADAPATELSATTIIEAQQKAVEQNNANATKRHNMDLLADAIKIQYEKVETCSQSIARLEREIDSYKQQRDNAVNEMRDIEAQRDALAAEVALLPENISLDSFKADIEKLEIENAKFRANRDLTKATREAQDAQAEYDAMTEKVESARREIMALLNGVKMPLDGLTVKNAKLYYRDQEWDCMSGAEQLIVATSIVRALNPECGFVLMDKLEAMDIATLETFNSWLVTENLQVIATRVSKGGECSIIIEDGAIAATN